MGLILGFVVESGALVVGLVTGPAVVGLGTGALVLGLRTGDFVTGLITGGKTIAMGALVGAAVVLVVLGQAPHL